MWKVMFLGFFSNKTPLLMFKSLLLRDILDSTSPKNPFWKVETKTGVALKRIWYDIENNKCTVQITVHTQFIAYTCSSVQHNEREQYVY